MNDLISRSALLVVPNVRKVTEYDETGCGISYNAVSVDAIEAAPTVDAEPVRRGKWEGWHGDYMRRDGKYQYFRYYECSKCCRRTAVKSNFCPNCGAKMDGGVPDEAV